MASSSLDDGTPACLRLREQTGCTDRNCRFREEVPSRFERFGEDFFTEKSEAGEKSLVEATGFQ
jgi:hypothetical protein